MQKSQFQLATVAASLITIILLILSLCGGASAFADVAASPRPSFVLDDLRQDPSFNAADYPFVADDYKLDVKQIAESTDGELLIYVYQPSGLAADLRATTVRVSQEIGNDLKFHDYPVTFLNASGVFFKYKVNDITIKPDNVRYYEITAIHRKWNKTYDKGTGNSTTINEVVFKVGQRWTVTTTESGVKYDTIAVETVELLTKYPGFRRYREGFYWDGTYSLDSHFIAFTCDHKIDKLLNVDVGFITTAYKRVANSYTYEEPEPHAVTLYDYEVSGINGCGVFRDNAEWHKISSVNDFISEAGITDKDEIALLTQYEWILNFYETQYNTEVGGKDALIVFIPIVGPLWALMDSDTANGVLVSEVTVMRMMFEYEGRIYNLGVVDNKQTEGPNPVNGKKGFPVWAVILIIAGVLIFILCVISKIFRKIVFGLIAAVTFPLWLPFWLAKKKRQERRQRRERERRRTERKQRRQERLANIKSKITGKLKRTPAPPSEPATTSTTTAPKNSKQKKAPTGKKWNKKK